MESNDELFTDLIDFAMASGVLMKTSEQECAHVSFTALPTAVPKTEFNELKRIQPHINKLMHLASQDANFLSTSLSSILETDEFTRNLFHIYEKAKSCQTKSKFELGVLRSDYMFDCNASDNSVSPKQIEINTIAVGFAGVAGNRLRSVHCRAMKKTGKSKDIASLPNNPSAEEIAKGLVEGWKSYGKTNAAIVFLVYIPEKNAIDQRAIEYAINLINEDIPVRRRSLNDVAMNGRLAQDGTLFIKDEEVAVVYFRSGFQPKDYVTQEHLDARLNIEMSKAIKCPSVALQLVGSKKIQEIFARPGVVEKFIDDLDIAASIRKTFAGLYTLEMNSDGDRAVELALSCPDDYVMKPQREGGGNNIYGNDIADVLRKIGNSEKRTAYILMDRVRPKCSKNFIVFKGKVTEAEVISELGIFGVYLAKGDKFLHNSSAAHLLRSKAKGLDEGGVMSGAAVLDSPLLV